MARIQIPMMNLPVEQCVVRFSGRGDAQVVLLAVVEGLRLGKYFCAQGSAVREACAKIISAALWSNIITSS